MSTYIALQNFGPQTIRLERDWDPRRATHVLWGDGTHTADARCWCRPRAERVEGGVLLVHRHFDE